MPFPLIPLAIAGGSAIAGALSGRKSARTSTSTSSTTPTLAPEYRTLADLLRGRAEQRLRSSTDMSGFQTQGLADIAQLGEGARLSAANNLTARGLSTSPVAATVGTNIDLAQQGEMAKFLNSIPLLQRQFENQDLSLVPDILNLGRGVSTSSTGVAPGSAVGSGIGSAAEMLAFLAGQGLFGGGKPEAFSF